MSFHRPITERMNNSLQFANLAYPETLELVPRNQWPAYRPPGLRECWRSRYFLLQVFREENGIERLSICSTSANIETQRFDDNISWDELQSLKSQCGRGDKEAVEIFPPDSDIVNVANMRHLWVLPERMKFSWRNAKTQTERN